MSWGGPACAEPGHPAVWMDVGKAAAWIRAVVKDGPKTFDNNNTSGRTTTGEFWQMWKLCQW